MQPANAQERYPDLFRTVTWPWGPVRATFHLLDEPPPSHLVANVNLVPRIGREWVILRIRVTGGPVPLLDGSVLRTGEHYWDIPGGTLEPGESYQTAMRRELLEEAGADLRSLRLFGAWHCRSLASEPYRPHLPFPEFYRVVGVGQVEIVRQPANPADGEQVVAVETVALETAVGRFRALGRSDLADLYRVAASLDAVGE